MLVPVPILIIVIVLRLSFNIAAFSPLHPSVYPQFSVNSSFSSASLSFTPSSCRYAANLSPVSLLTNSTLRTQFIHDLLYWEAQFLQPSPCPASAPPSSAPPSSPPYVGLHFPTMMTLDGHRLALASGLPLGSPHLFTASSKESLHVAILARALLLDPLAARFLSPSSPSTDAAVAIALHQLQVKVNSYDTFNCRFPGYGGFLPWVDVNDEDGVTPAEGWEHQVPALDNGQLIWAVVAAVHLLEQSGYADVRHLPLDSKPCKASPDLAFLTAPDTTLAARYRALLDRWTRNLLPVFYDSDGQYRAVSYILNTSSWEVQPSNYYTGGCDDCYLDDPYEGELFVFFAYLYCDWSGWTGREQVWTHKRRKLQLATLRLTDDAGREQEITVQRGFWFSAHEQWKYLFLPYRDVPINDRVFVLGEKARVAYSRQQRVPGLYASVNGLCVDDRDPGDYHSDCGVPDIASQPVTTHDIVTPYGSMNLMLLLHTPPPTTQAFHPSLQPHSYPSASPASNATAVGLVWLATMIRSHRGQSCYGVTEGSAVNGTLVSPLRTWDTGITTVLALMGGVVDIVREVLETTGAYGQFVQVVEREWGRVFGGEGVLKGEELGWAMPSADIPDAQPGWWSCTDVDTACKCSEQDAGTEAKQRPQQPAQQQHEQQVEVEVTTD